MLRRFLLALPLLAALPAQAGEIVQHFDFIIDRDAGDQPLSVARFDSTRGTLTGVTYHVGGTQLGSITVSRDPAYDSSATGTPAYVIWLRYLQFSGGTRR